MTEERDIAEERSPGTTNAAQSATPESQERADRAAGAGHAKEEDRKIDGAADAGPGEDPEGATSHVEPTSGDRLGSASNEKPGPQ